MGGKFNFKIKIVQTDLTGGDDFYGYNNYNSYYSCNDFGGGFTEESPLMYQNSRYISKLFFINNISGGILAKDKIEDMPERYKRFITFDNPSPADIVGSFKREMDEHITREEIGQNVFYSRISNPAVLNDPAQTEKHTKSASKSKKETGTVSAKSEIKPEIYEFISDIGVSWLEKAGLTGRDDESFFAGLNDEIAEQLELEDAASNEFDEYSKSEEIKNILHLNNYFNSEEYKMSNVVYDFNSFGHINLNENGALEIKYDESELTGFDGSFSQILFDAKSKDIVTIRRKSFFDTWFTLEKGKRISIGETGRFAGEVHTTVTRELVNNMTADGGEMSIVYVTETNGYPSEMISHTISAERVRD